MTTIHLNQTDSTNLYLERRLKELPNICSVRADIQTAGRGRLARQWDSSKGGLWFSLLFKTPALSPFQLQKVCSLATLKILNSQLELIKNMNFTNQNEKFLLKWPNDIYYASKKIAGCLQKNMLSSIASNCIIGIGVNINNPLPEALTQKAINLKTILFKETPVEHLYQHILENIEQRLEDFSHKALDAEYKKHLLIKDGVRIHVLDVVNNSRYTGRVIGYPGESLEILTEEGLHISFQAADVTLKSWES